MLTIDEVKDVVDDLLSVPDGTLRTERKLKTRLERARDLVEYIQIHHIDTLETDIAERAADRRRARRSK